MKKTTCFLTSAFLVLSLLLPGSAFAQREKKEKVVKAVTPPQDMFVLPEPEAPPPALSTFPELPPSNPCVEGKISGLFHLAAVYEEPATNETTQFSTKPNQYLRFYNDKTYARANMEQPNMPIDFIEKAMKGHSSDLLQYVVQENGFVYFYQNGVAKDVQACFVVANDKIPFKAGQILLIPPKGQITGRRVKVYEDTAIAQNSQADQNKNAANNRDDKKNKPKWRKNRKINNH